MNRLHIVQLPGRTDEALVFGPYTSHEAIELVRNEPEAEGVEPGLITCEEVVWPTVVWREADMGDGA
jgi:hypothetical protein